MNFPTVLILILTLLYVGASLDYKSNLAQEEEVRSAITHSVLDPKSYQILDRVVYSSPHKEVVINIDNTNTIFTLKNVAGRDPIILNLDNENCKTIKVDFALRSHDEKNTTILKNINKLKNSVNFYNFKTCLNTLISKNAPIINRWLDNDFKTEKQVSNLKSWN